MDNIEDDYDSFITKRELRKKYKDYCKEHKVSGVSDKSIIATLQENYGVSDDKKMTIDGQERVWSGIKFKEKNN